MPVHYTIICLINVLIVIVLLFLVLTVAAAIKKPLTQTFLIISLNRKYLIIHNRVKPLSHSVITVMFLFIAVAIIRNSNFVTENEILDIVLGKKISV